MPDTALRRSALSLLDVQPTAAADAGLHLSEVPHTAKITLRGSIEDRDFVTAVGRALDLVLPAEPNRVQARGDVDAIWLGPDEWLIVAAPGRERDLETLLREAVAGLAASVVDVTENTTVIRAAGPALRAVLAKGCPLDVHPRVFGAGQCAQTLFAQVDLLIVLTADETTDQGAEGTAVPSADLYVRRSFADHLWRFLLDAGQEFGVAVRG